MVSCFFACLKFAFSDGLPFLERADGLIETDTFSLLFYAQEMCLKAWCEGTSGKEQPLCRKRQISLICLDPDLRKSYTGADRRTELNSTVASRQRAATATSLFLSIPIKLFLKAYLYVFKQPSTNLWGASVALQSCPHLTPSLNRGLRMESGLLVGVPVQSSIFPLLVLMSSPSFQFYYFRYVVSTL